MNDPTPNSTPQQTHQGETEQDTTGFFFREDVIRWILWIFYACCVGLFLIDFFIHRHTSTDIEKIPGFYAIYGLLACVILVVLAKWMRIFLIREENYYDEPEEAHEYLQKQGLELPSKLADRINTHSASSEKDQATTTSGNQLS